MSEALRLSALLESAWAADASPDEMMQAAAELRRLHAENEALRKDAERYQWLKQMCFRAVTMSATPVPLNDAAIDAAMKEANHG